MNRKWKTLWLRNLGLVNLLHLQLGGKSLGVVTEANLVFFFTLKKIEVQFTYNVVLITAVQQSDSVIHGHTHTYSFPLWFIIGN